MLTILFDGVAYGMLLFVLACGLAVTLGLMNFVNLAHGAFAMAGGYITVILMNRYGVPFLATLPAAFLFRPLSALVLERRSIVASTGAAISIRCCSRSASSSWRWRQSTTPWARSSSSSAAGLAAGPLRRARHRDRPLPRFIIASAACSSSRCSWSYAYPLRQPPARRRRRPPRRARASAFASDAIFASRSRSAPGLPVSAARSAPRSSGSIRRFR